MRRVVGRSYDASSPTLLTIIHEDVSKAEVAINLLSTSRYMERIADLSTNIAEDVMFMVDGRVFRHID